MLAVLRGVFWLVGRAIHDSRFLLVLCCRLYRSATSWQACPLVRSKQGACLSTQAYRLMPMAPCVRKQAGAQRYADSPRPAKGR